jgi:hypothetical protein
MCLDCTYYLVNDIDCSESKTWNSGKGFIPIVNFEGTLDGKGHKIVNLYINRPSEDKVGLFKNIKNAKITNLHIVNATIHGKYNVGVIAGYSENSDITNIIIENSRIAGCAGIAGAVGWSKSSKFQLIKVSGIVEFDGRNLTNSDFGGIVGYSENSTIQEAYFDGEIHGTNGVGGLIGYSNSNNVLDVYSKGNIEGTVNVGGIAGGAAESTIQRVFSVSKISGKNYVGALLGSAYNSYLSGGYYDIYMTAQSKCVGHVFSSTIFCSGIDEEGSNVDYWYHKENPPMDQWNFNNIWVEVPNNYPKLSIER